MRVRARHQSEPLSTRNPLYANPDSGWRHSSQLTGISRTPVGARALKSPDSGDRKFLYAVVTSAVEGAPTAPEFRVRLRNQGWRHTTDRDRNFLYATGKAASWRRRHRNSVCGCAHQGIRIARFRRPEIFVRGDDHLLSEGRRRDRNVLYGCTRQALRHYSWGQTPHTLERARARARARVRPEFRVRQCLPWALKPPTQLTGIICTPVHAGLWNRPTQMTGFFCTRRECCAELGRGETGISCTATPGRRCGATQRAETLRARALGPKAPEFCVRNARPLTRTQDSGSPNLWSSMTQLICINGITKPCASASMEYILFTCKYF